MSLSRRINEFRLPGDKLFKEVSLSFTEKSIRLIQHEHSNFGVKIVNQNPVTRIVPDIQSIPQLLKELTQTLKFSN